MLEDGDEVLAQAERVPEEIGALATAIERLDPSEQRAVGACARPSTPGCIQTQQPAPWPSDNLNLVCVSGRAPAKHRVERVALDRPVASVRHRQDVPHDAFRRHAACPPLCAREQRLIRIAFGEIDRFALRCTALHIFGNWNRGLRVDVFFHRRLGAEVRQVRAPRARGRGMAKKRRAHDEEAWTNAKKICRLNARQVEMARARGMNPRKLPGLRPSPQERWKLPVGEFIEERCRKRFGRAPRDHNPCEAEPSSRKFRATGRM